MHQLRIFDAVARNLSFARAAEELHLTPPALSIQVKQLGETVGQPLTEQIGKKIFLTAAGQILADAARDILMRLDRLSEDLAALQGLEHGHVRLAILGTAKYFLPRLLGEFCTQHPGIEASLFVGNREAVLERLARNEDDIYILGQPPESIGVVAEPFADNPLILVARPDHPLAVHTDVDPKLLNHVPFILREEGSGTRLVTQRFFARHNIHPPIRMELGIDEAIKQAVAGGLGVAVLSAIALRTELAARELVPLDVRGFPLARKWYAVHAHNKALSPSARAFYDYLFAAAPQLLQEQIGAYPAHRNAESV